MAKVMKILTAIFMVAFVVLLALNLAFGGQPFLALSITAGVIFYHFAMRLAVGIAINALMKNRANYNAWWFRERKWEKGFYGFIKVKKWKKFAPTYAPDTFSPSVKSWEEIAMATCQAEIVHEIIIALSFLPLFLIIPFGEPLVFILTSVISALIDTVFVILQRFNRPRIIKLIQRSEKNEK